MRYPALNTRLISLVLGMFALLLMSGCSHYKVDFSLDDSQFKTKGASIAIVSGTREAQNVMLAQMISDSLRRKSRYQVASASQISKAFGTYPQNIKGPYKSAYYYIDTDWELVDKKKIVSIQHALGVDYLYVIWAPISVSTNGSATQSMPVIGQLFEQPSSKEVAKLSSWLAVGDEGNLYIKEGVDEIVRQLAEATKMIAAIK